MTFDIDIHGSCVSRDVFNFDSNNEIKLGKYFTRQSFVSTMSNPFPGEIDINLPSPFQRRMVECDLKKDLFARLSENPANYLMIDFIDERLLLGVYKKSVFVFNIKKSIFTYSDELRNSKFVDGMNIKFIDKLTMNRSIWKKAMNKYIEQLLKIYDEERVIIHETYLIDIYISKNCKIIPFPEVNLEYNKKVNKILHEYYDYLKNKLPNATVINIVKDYRSFENHRWGLSPVHYEDKYYEDVLKLIKKIV